MQNISDNHLIMLVEDCPEDYETTVRAFKETGLSNHVIHCKDGDDALDYLFNRDRYSDPAKFPRPAIILLDLNLPGTDGREVLSEIKRDESLRKIPVVVLTTSSDEMDIDRCYSAGANSYILKPVDLDSFFDTIKRFKDYWFKVCILPGEE
ncbi:MAG: response regulator [Gammaproteobacteria bacterium]|nr:response regulator [Gammaproteobacteria bacterium]